MSPVPAHFGQPRSNPPYQSAGSHKSGGPPWVPFLIAGGAGVAVLFMVGFLLLVNAAVWHAEKTRGERAALRELDEQGARLTSKQIAAMTGDTEYGAVSEDYDKMLDTMESTSQKLSGPDATIMKVGANILRELQQSNDSFQVVMERFNSAGGVNPGSLSSKSAIDQRLQMISEMRGMSKRVVTTVQGLPERFSGDLRKASVPESAIQAALTGFRKTANLELVAQIRTLDDTIFTHAAGAMNLLKREWGHWEFEAASGNVLFESESALAEYNRSIQGLQAAATQQEALQRSLLRAQGQTSGR